MDIQVADDPLYQSPCRYPDPIAQSEDYQRVGLGMRRRGGDGGGLLLRLILDNPLTIHNFCFGDLHARAVR
jgi:hypothetical protein